MSAAPRQQDQQAALERAAAGMREKLTEYRTRMLAAEKLAAGLMATITGLQNLHCEYRIYDECGHDHDDDDPARVDCGDFSSCEDAYLYSVCEACCTEPDYGQTEECAASHDHGPGKPLCPTAAILGSAA